MRIGLLLGGLQGNGGIGRVTSLVAEELNKRHDITIITYAPYDSNTALYHFPQSVKILSLNQKGTMKSYILNGGIRKLRKIIKDNNLQIVIACGALFFPICVFSRKGTIAKVICWEHSNANNISDHSFQMICRKCGTKMADAVVTITKQDYEMFMQKMKPRLLRQIYNPVDKRIQYQYSVDIDPHRIISVGRLTYQKNYPLLINVAKVILSKYPNWTWDIYGEGPDRQEIEKLIFKTGLSNRLILKGQVDNLYERYGDYSFYVITSRYEGFGMALIEANRAGLPIISFNVECGPKEIINNGVNGLLIEPLNEDKMIEAISSLCDNREKCLELSENAKTDDNKFCIEDIGNEWEKLFEELT